MPFNQTFPNDLECVGFLYNNDVFPALYFLIFPIASLLNGVAAWVSLHLKSTSTFMVYLKNLVAADVVLTLLIPIKAASGLEHKSKTLFILSCYVSPVIYSALYTCITLLGLIGLDRFVKTMTLQSKLFGQNVTFSKLLSGSVWVLLFAGTGLPNMILSNNLVNITEASSCMDMKAKIGLSYHENSVIILNVFFWFVSVVIAVCYICITNKVIQSFRNSGSNNNQGKQKVKLRVFLVVIVFFLSFGPYHIVRIPYTFQQVNSSSNTGCSYLLSKFAKNLSLWCAITNICMNPLLYIFLCREFKEKLMAMMKNVSASFQVTSLGKAGTTSP